MMIIFPYFACLYILTFSQIYANGESLSHLEDILDLESIRIHSLESIIDLQEMQLLYLKQWVKIIYKKFCNNFLNVSRQVNELKAKHNEAKIDAKSYLANPINIFQLMKRQTNDWQEIEDRVSVNFAHGRILYLAAKDLTKLYMILQKS